MPRLNRAAYEHAAAQHAVITANELLAHGISVRQIERLVAQGAIERLLDGVYRFTAAPPDDWSRCVAVSKRPGNLVVAGPTAGRLYGFRRLPPPDTIHVIAPPASHPSVETWVAAYRTSVLDPSDVIMRPDGIRITSHRRTVLDLTRFLDDTNLRSVIDQALANRWTTLDDLVAVAELTNTPGRPWVRRFLRIATNRADGGAPESHDESRVVAALLEAGVPVTTQRWLDVPAFGRIRLDACVEAIRWGIEIDGHPEHFSETGAAHDRERDLACDAIGWRIARVASLTLQRDFPTSIGRLVAAYRRRCAEVSAMRGTTSLQPHLSSHRQISGTR